MAEPLKNVYTRTFLENFTSSCKKVIPELDQQKVGRFVFGNNWDQLELKERMSRLAKAMSLFLPKKLEEAAPVLKKMIDTLEQDNFPVNGFEYMFIPEFVEKNGIDHLHISLELFERITQFVSCEFAIRPFIIKYRTPVMEQMLEWSNHKHANVRRFSSEGCRSRLPWAMAIPEFKKDASLILPILENLKADSSLFVRKSVANNLNDISKDHPELALKLASQWFGKNDKTDWVVKHGCRTLLKAGYPKALKLFGYAPIESLSVSNMHILSPSVNFGSSLIFSFSVKNKTKNDITVRLEYAIYFLKGNGSSTKKVFKISERELLPQQKLTVEKSHVLKAISTRKYYAGEHGLSIIVNGIEFKKQPFLLNM